MPSPLLVISLTLPALPRHEKGAERTATTRLRCRSEDEHRQEVDGQEPHGDPDEAAAGDGRGSARSVASRARPERRHLPATLVTLAIAAAPCACEYAPGGPARDRPRRGATGRPSTAFRGPGRLGRDRGARDSVAGDEDGVGMLGEGSQAIPRSSAVRTASDRGMRFAGTGSARMPADGREPEPETIVRRRSGRRTAQPARARMITGNDAAVTSDVAALCPGTENLRESGGSRKSDRAAGAWPTSRSMPSRISLHLATVPTPCSRDRSPQSPARGRQASCGSRRKDEKPTSDAQRRRSAILGYASRVLASAPHPAAVR